MLQRKVLIASLRIIGYLELQHSKFGHWPIKYHKKEYQATYYFFFCCCFLRNYKLDISCELSACLADNSLETSNLNLSEKWEKIQNAFCCCCEWWLNSVLSLSLSFGFTVSSLYILMFHALKFLKDYGYASWPFPSTYSRRAVVIFWQKNVHNTG